MQAAKVQITLNHIPTTIFSVYCPPRPAISVQEVEQFLNSVGNTSLIGGDFNSKHPQWGCRVENTCGRMFKNVLQNKRYTVISPPGPTYWPSHRNRHPDILDLFLSTIPRHIISTIKNLDYPACDHSPVFLQLNGKITLKPPRPTLAKGPVNWELFSENLQNSTNLKISLKTDEQIEEAVQNLTTSIQTAVYNSSFKTNIPVENSILKNSLPLHIQELIKTKRRARARWQRYNLSSDKRILNNLTNTIKKLIQQHKSTFFQEKYESLNTKNGSLWKTTKNILQIKECSTPLNCPNGQLAISDNDKAETFGNCLSKTFTPHSNINPELEYLDEINNFLNSPLPMSLPAKHTTPNEAFDRVGHIGLLYKLKLFLPAPYYLLIRSYLCNRSFAVRQGNSFSSYFSIQAGVPQGSDLAPDLFNIYTSDIPKVANTTIATYADDTAILASNTDLTLASSALQNHLDLINSWATQWRIKINPEKSYNVIFSLRKNDFPPLQLQGVDIPKTSQVKYLGLILDKRLTWGPHLKSKRKTLNNRLHLLRPILKSKMSIHIKSVLYKSLLRPIWAYGMQIWGCAKPSQIRSIHAFQSISLQLIASAPWYITNKALHKDLKIDTVDQLAQNYYAKFHKLESVHRRSQLRAACCYSTVSHEAAAVVSGIPPIRLLAKERTEVFEGKGKSEARLDLIINWQREWENCTNGRWTFRLINDLPRWQSRTFGEATDSCEQCGFQPDDAEHAFFNCDAWENWRRRVCAEVDVEELTPENLTNTMLVSSFNWNQISKLMSRIMTAREEAERIRQGNRHKNLVKLYQTFRKLFAESTKFYKAGKNERIQDFAGRIEKIYHELTYALTIGKNATESKIIAQTIQGQASSVFMSGVHPAINTILEARAVTTFELAVVIAMEKERNFGDRKSGYDKNKNKNIKNKIKCNRCNKMGHYANECYSKVTTSSGFRNPTYNDIKKENTGQVKFCKYCRKTNHDIKDCRKRIFNENKKKQEGGYTPSNETNRTAGEIQNNVRKLESVHRRSQLRAACCYSTVSHDAAAVVSGIPPIRLLAKERTEVFEGKGKSEARLDLIINWQREWENCTNERWTFRLINDLPRWQSRTFGEATDSCEQCGFQPDDAEHAFFNCDAWENWRRRVCAEVDVEELTPENLTNTMLVSSFNWNQISKLMSRIMTAREEAERIRQGQPT
ncbi:hypothetical protein QTP88_007828 [Uroleucon formosanum]